MNDAGVNRANGRGLCLIAGVLYMAAGVLVGLNVESLWALYAPQTGGWAEHRILSALTVVFPHILVIAGFVLLVAGGRISRRSFVAVGLLPAAYAAVCLFVRAAN